MIRKRKDNINIYLVDDDELHLRILLNKFSTTTSYNINTYTNGEDLLEFFVQKSLPKKSINIVVLDYMLSISGDRKNGVEILRLLKEINSETEVIMLSGKGDIDTAINAMHYGAVTFIEKSESSFARLNNNIKWIISEKRLKQKKGESVFSTKLFIYLSLGVLVVLYLIYLIFPNLF